jgi:hypothetical protein
MEAQARGDVWAMVQAALALVEPLPPVDADMIFRDIKEATYTYLLAVESKHSHWWERTSAAYWMQSIAVISAYRVPIPMDLLLFARATLLYDTLAARLDPALDVYTEYRRWARDAERKSRQRVVAGVRRRVWRGPTDSDYATLERLGGLVRDGAYRLERLFAVPREFFRVPYTIEKGVFVSLVLLQFLVRLLALTLGLGLVVLLGASFAGQPTDPGLALITVLENSAYRFAVAVLGAVHLRVIMLRMAQQRPGY